METALPLGRRSFGNRRVFRVVSDRHLMEGVKPGDVVTITFTRAQAVAITKAP